MSVGPIVETAIGLIFVYLLLGLIGTAVQEAFASITKLRGKYLLEGLSKLLADEARGIWSARRHLLGRSLANVGPGKPGSALFGEVATHCFIVDTGSKAAPSYATARSFFAALTDSLTKNASPLRGTGDPITAALVRQLTTEAAKIPEGEGAGLRSLLATPAMGMLGDRHTVEFLKLVSHEIAALPPSDAKIALRVLVPETLGLPDNAQIAAASLFKAISDGIDALPNGEVKETLTALRSQAVGGLDDFKGKVERWFDEGMERLSGVYKRFTQYFTLAFGLAIAVTLNVSTIRVAEHLWTDEESRATLVAAATAYVDEAAKADPGAPATPAPGAVAANVDGADGPTLDEITGNFTTAIGAVREQLDTLSLPIGWTAASNPFADGNAGEILTSLLGWLLTALAVSLGAPFWFDMLNRFVRIRAAGTAPDEVKNR